MSTPAEHYREAERLLGVATDLLDIKGADVTEAAFAKAQEILLAQAQVHATLACTSTTTVERAT